jgi:hypothetical protein
VKSKAQKLLAQAKSLLARAKRYCAISPSGNIIYNDTLIRLTLSKPKKEELMPNTREHIAEIMDVVETDKNVGLTCTIEIRAYDKGMINVNGSPAGNTDRRSEKWMHATRKVMQILEQFEEQVAERHAHFETVSAE